MRNLRPQDRSRESVIGGSGRQEKIRSAYEGNITHLNEGPQVLARPQCRPWTIHCWLVEPDRRHRCYQHPLLYETKVARGTKVEIAWTE